MRTELLIIDPQVDFCDPAVGALHVKGAEAVGKTPPASRYSPDMTKHSFLGSDPLIARAYQDYAGQL